MGDDDAFYGHAFALLYLLGCHGHLEVMVLGSRGEINWVVASS